MARQRGGVVRFVMRNARDGWRADGENNNGERIGVESSRTYALWERLFDTCESKEYVKLLYVLPEDVWKE